MANTRYNRITHMSAEELAEFISRVQFSAYAKGLVGEPVHDFPNEKDAWLNWLRKETSE